ncbi:MAG: anhydro-N-acetylmuramic acid kinase [Alphaproteobacteria bacterium]|nr:anhydro-N-acetylmuramic acid kinase [Alphaproteobacteria bacterium]
MTKLRIIGNMTGNSMDAVDLVLTEFDGDKMKDICSFTKPYDKNMQDKIESLRVAVYNKTRAEISALPEFVPLHNEYVRQIADCVNEMCEIYDIDKASIDAIGFHGKTLDHNPPSKAKIDGTLPYTLQIGSGKMLADLTGIKVVYDFRSDAVMNGFDGAPLVSPHNAHIASSEGDGCYYNGGNTSNFALIENGKAILGADAGPFNEYTDAYIRKHTDLAYDENAQIGKNGKLNTDLLQRLYDFGRHYYETALPKSGDPAYYHKTSIFAYVEKNDISLQDAVHTFEYFAAYIAVQALTLIPQNINVPNRFILFGGGWKNPLVKRSFEDLLNGIGCVLPEHTEQFTALVKRFKQSPQVLNSSFGDYMEARLFADLARYKLQEKAWEIPEIARGGKSVVCGIIAEPEENRNGYDDMVNRAAKGWQADVIK